MSQLSETEMHAPKVIFSWTVLEASSFSTHRRHWLCRESKPNDFKAVGHDGSQVFEWLKHTFCALILSGINIIPQSENHIWNHKLIQTTHLRQRRRADPAQGVRNHWKFSGSARSLVIGRSHTVQVSMLSWAISHVNMLLPPTYVDPSWNLGQVSFIASK